MNDRTKLGKIKKIDTNTFRQLFDRYFQSLFVYTYGFTHDKETADDIVQQAFIVLWEKRNEMENILSVKAYLHRICYNIYINQLRSEQKEKSLFDELKQQALAERIEMDDEILEKKILHLRTIIGELPEKCREILLKNKVEGLRYRDIAGQLNISVKTVESQMRIAYQKIREKFESDDVWVLWLLQGK